MNSNQFRRNKLSDQCHQRLARVVLPDQRAESLAEIRFQDFLEREGLAEHELIRQPEKVDEIAERRRRLFGLVTGGAAAALVILSLQMLFGGHQSGPNYAAVAPDSQVVAPITEVRLKDASADYQCRVPLP